MTEPKDHATGYGLLHNPRLNKGTAFTEAERRAYGLEGLLPPAVTSVELQVARRHAEIANLDNDLQKYLVLSDLQARNETLFYAVLMSDPATYMPLVYTPTVGEACQKFAHIFREARGMFLPISSRGRAREILGNWPEKDVRFIVVTDGERILGLGDLGAGGMGILLGKLALYTACAGVPPQYCLPVVLDVGTNNQTLLDDPLYLGLQQPRLRGDAYDALVDEFVTAARELFPGVVIQFEDFATQNAFRLLQKYRDRIPTFNDDIQGTAAVSLAGILSALRISGGKLSEQTLLFQGAGEAATGIADLVAAAMMADGLDLSIGGLGNLAQRGCGGGAHDADGPGDDPRHLPGDLVDRVAGVPPEHLDTEDDITLCGPRGVREPHDRLLDLRVEELGGGTGTDQDLAAAADSVPRRGGHRGRPDIFCNRTASMRTGPDSCRPGPGLFCAAGRTRTVALCIWQSPQRAVRYRLSTYQ